MIQGEAVDSFVSTTGKLYIRYSQDRVIELSEFENMTIWGQRTGVTIEEE
jgi:hypothetical protein